MSFERLALPGVICLIAFIAYGPQLLFRSLEPHPLGTNQTRIFNSLVVCIWITYVRACFTNPGFVPTEWLREASASKDERATQHKYRWCTKCNALKPLRAHHCKVCRRCIPKMDHHCPWTVNCVSHRTFPHFFRFLFYAVCSMVYLEYFIYIRVAVIWKARNLPIYLGPSPMQMVFLFIFLVVNSVTLFALGILLARNIWCLGGNVTSIEGWEIERHETLVYRARKQGGYLDGPDGTKVRIKKQEFPYDIGVYQNIRQGMGVIPLLWLWPFAPTPSNVSGLEFETNGFEDPTLSWPPPDPDRMPRFKSGHSYRKEFTHEEDSAQGKEWVKAFRQRQQEDMKRLEHENSGMIFRRRLQTFGNGQESPGDYQQSAVDKPLNEEQEWRDSDGHRLNDFGVDEATELLDEDAEFFHEDNTPLAELIRRRQADTKTPSTV